MPPIENCPCTLAAGNNTYSRTGLNRLFNGKRVSHVLPFMPPQVDEEIAEKFRQNRKILSISGVQVKQSMLLDKNHLRITNEGEQGEYILKPIPHRETIGNIDQLPANEHLTMQIARQVYAIDTAENGLVFFKNGEPAYLTKRFDLNDDGTKTPQEDFASLLQRTRDTHGKLFKNEGSYELMAQSMKTYIPAYPVEIEKFFRLVLFNYLFCNGDAHLKNFSVRRSKDGDYLLSPAYDLINTKIHIKDDISMALTDGLFEGDYETESFTANGFFAYDDFFEFSQRIGILESRAKRMLDQFRTSHDSVLNLIQRSFLSGDAKVLFTNCYTDRLNALNYSFTGII